MDKYFLKKDLEQACREKAYAHELLIQSQVLLNENKFYAVEEKLVDILKSVHELKKMQGNKKTQDRFEELVGNLQAKEIDAILLRSVLTIS